MRIGLLGGSFNPIHNGHINLARAALTLPLDCVLFVLADFPPHKQHCNLPSFETRTQLVKRAISHEPQFKFCGIERELPKPSYAITTVQKLKQEYPEDELFFIIGADSLRDFPGWYRITDLLEEIRFIILNRPGFDVFKVLENLPFNSETILQLKEGVVDAPELDVSSTQVRHMVCNGENISNLVPEGIPELIHSFGLYKD